MGGINRVSLKSFLLSIATDFDHLVLINIPEMEIIHQGTYHFGGYFAIFKALLLAVQASVRNALVSQWYCTFSYSAVFEMLPGRGSNGNDKFGEHF